MKIKKLVEAKKLVEEDNTIDTSGSTEEIKQDIKDQVEQSTDGTKTISDKDAEQAAQAAEVGSEIANTDEAVFALTDEDWADVQVKNRLYAKLDRSYKKALENMGKHKVAANTNILIEGLPGAGKTAIVKAWCKMNGLICVAFNATDSKIESAINGMPMRDMTKPDENALAYSYVLEKLGPLMDKKNAKKCVIFVDELNRQKSEQMRRPFMSLFNEKQNADGTLDFTETLLFSVVCINPTDGGGIKYYDRGVGELTQAELNRFFTKLRDFDSNIPEAIDYWTWFKNSELLELGIIPPGTAASVNHNDWVGPTKKLDEDDLAYAKLVIKAYTLAKYIFDNLKKSKETEIFTQRKDVEKSYLAGSKNYVTQRSLFEGIINNTEGDDESPVPAFLDWVDGDSDFHVDKKKMFHDILDDYTMDVKNLFAEYNINKTPAQIKQEAESGEVPEVDTENTDDADIEDDDETFGSDELDNVSKANADNIAISDIDSAMAGWDD